MPSPSDPLHGLALSVSETPSAEEYATLLKALDDDARAVLGPSGLRSLGVMVRAQGAIVGGLLGRTIYRWLMVDVVWIADDWRGRGVGSALVREAEQVARDRGCIAATVETFDFQSRPFYEKLGYAVHAARRDLPPGHDTYILTRALA